MVATKLTEVRINLRIMKKEARLRVETIFGAEVKSFRNGTAIYSNIHKSMDVI